MARVALIVRNTWRDLAYHVLAMPASVFAFVVVVTGVSIAVSFALLIVGLPVALGVFIVFRWCARLERYRASLWLGPIGEAYRPRRDGLAAADDGRAHRPVDLEGPRLADLRCTSA